MALLLQERFSDKLTKKMLIAFSISANSYFFIQP